MRVLLPQDFYSTLNNCHLLLDTSVFIDASLNPQSFSDLFNDLRDHDVILVTIDAVIAEFLKGAANQSRLQEKKALVESIIDTSLPVTKDIFNNVLELVELYKEDGKAASIVDLILGATIKYHKKGLYLLTKNTKDFPTNIFELSTYITLVYKKGIHTYGIYKFNNDL